LAAIEAFVSAAERAVGERSFSCADGSRVAAPALAERPMLPPAGSGASGKFQLPLGAAEASIKGAVAA
jgi:hypothetical protein